jgi:hypothetical protein
MGLRLLRMGVPGVANEFVLDKHVERGILPAVVDSGIRQHRRGLSAG